MAIGLPNIDIVFIQKAVSAVLRSERGTAVVILKDDTQPTAGYDIYKFEADITKKKFTEENVKLLKRCFYVNVNKLVVVHVPTSTTEFADVKAVLDKVKYNWACTVEKDWQTELVSYTKSHNVLSKGRKVKCVVANVTVADDKHIVNMKGDYVHEADADSTTTVKMTDYLPRVVSILANLPMNRSITYYELEDLDYVDNSFITNEKDANKWTDEGWLLLINDDEDAVVRVGRGVNTLTTFTSTDTEDMRKIIIVESMDLMMEDLYSTFKKYYVGKYKNHLDNQYLFISSVNSYFRSLTKVVNGEILDPEYDNHAYIDVENQREAWLSVGKLEAEDWDEDKVKKMSFKSTVYLAAKIKILDAMEDLSFQITMEQEVNYGEQ